MQTPQRETPPSGTNHREAQNTENTGAIVAQVPAGGNQPASEPVTNAEDYVRELAKGNTARLLAKAANFAAMHAPHTLWKRCFRIGQTTLTVRLEWPGVLCVYDPSTGDKLAESLPGQPATLQKQ